MGSLKNPVNGAESHLKLALAGVIGLCAAAALAVMRHKLTGFVKWAASPITRRLAWNGPRRRGGSVEADVAAPELISLSTPKNIGRRKSHFQQSILRSEFTFPSDPRRTSRAPRSPLASGSARHLLGSHKCSRSINRHRHRNYALCPFRSEWLVEDSPGRFFACTSPIFPKFHSILRSSSLGSRSGSAWPMGPAVRSIGLMYPATG